GDDTAKACVRRVRRQEQGGRAVTDVQNIDTQQLGEGVLLVQQFLETFNAYLWTDEFQSGLPIDKKNNLMVSGQRQAVRGSGAINILECCDEPHHVRILDAVVQVLGFAPVGD